MSYEFKITAKDRQFLLQINPDRVTTITGSRSVDFAAIRAGEFSQYGGRKAESISFRVTLLGCADLLYRDRWFAPDELIHQLQNTLNPVDRGRVYLDCPDLDIGAWYMLKQITEDRSGAKGDVDLTIDVVEDRDLLLRTVDEVATQGSGDAPVAVPSDTTAAAPDEQTSADTPQTSYTVRSGDTLWAIANDLLGDGSRWREIYEANQDQISDPNSIMAGLVLVIPQ